MLLTLAFAWSLLPAMVDPPQDSDWWSVDRYVVETLLERDRGEWVRQLLAEPMPENAVSRMVRLNVLVRDGRMDQALSTLEAMTDPPLPNEAWLWSQMADFLIDRGDDALVRALCERFPLAQPGWGYVWARRQVEAEGLESVDRWLEARRAAARRAREAQPDPRWHDREDYWLAVRVEIHEHVRNLPRLRDDLIAQVRADPADLSTAIACLNLSTRMDPPAAPQWMLDVFKPRGAYDAHRLGEAMAGPWPDLAATLFERSLATPFNDADEAALCQLALSSQRVRHLQTRDELERILRWQTKNALAQAYQRSGQSDKAQPLIEALIQVSVVPPSLAELAGQVQASTGARAIEGRILEAEQAEADSSEYWIGRGQYFAGRGEHDEAERAFAQALQLSPLDGDPPRFKDTAFRRSMALGRYVHYLLGQDRTDDALALIYREFDATPPDSEYARRLVDKLWNRFSGALTLDNDRLWTWLAAQPRWEHLEERVLHRIAEKAGPQRTGEPDQRARVWARALPLVKDAHASRASVLGWVMTRHHASDQAVPLLRDAVERLEDDEARQQTLFTLFEACLALDDARQALELWPSARSRLGGREIPDWLGRIVDAAQRGGDVELADQLRRVRTNLDHRWAR